jgi:hypothetical protein
MRVRIDRGLSGGPGGSCAAIPSGSTGTFQQRTVGGMKHEERRSPVPASGNKKPAVAGFEGCVAADCAMEAKVGIEPAYAALQAAA